MTTEIRPHTGRAFPEGCVAGPSRDRKRSNPACPAKGGPDLTPRSGRPGGRRLIYAASVAGLALGPLLTVMAVERGRTAEMVGGSDPQGVATQTKTARLADPAATPEGTGDLYDGDPVADAPDVASAQDGDGQLYAGEAEPPAPAEAERHWYDGVWPLGERVEVEALKTRYVPYMTQATPATIGTIPGRPELALELGNGFLSIGNLSPGFEVPLTGAIWQPRVWGYVINRTAVQTFDDGRSGKPRETEIATRTDAFVNLQLSGTEKVLLGIRPTDNNRPDRFTRYTFEGASEGFNDEAGFNVETLFFEGDLGSVFPALDKVGDTPIDLGFTVGRQPIVFQEGILINDTIDAVGLIRNNIPFPGTSNFRVSALYGWNRVDRNDTARDPGDEDLFGVFAAADTALSTFNIDTIYVDDDNNGDGLYFGFAAIQRLPFLGGVSTAFRVNTSIALEDEIPGNVVGTGTLLTSEISRTVPGSNDIVYFNSFLGIGNFTQAGREAVVGGPLANTGILFASPSLSTYGSELDNFTGDDVVGGAVGYQAFFDNRRRNLILEIAGRHDISGTGFDSLGFGAQLQQAIGQHLQLQLEAFYALNEGRDDGFGARAEIQVVY